MNNSNNTIRTCNTSAITYKTRKRIIRDVLYLYIWLEGSSASSSACRICVVCRSIWVCHCCIIINCRCSRRPRRWRRRRWGWWIRRGFLLFRDLSLFRPPILKPDFYLWLWFLLFVVLVFNWINNHFRYICEINITKSTT